MSAVFGQSVTVVPERWQKWAEKCRDQAGSSRKWFTAVLAMFDESAARWIEDAVPDSQRAIRVRVQSDDQARSKVVEALNSGRFNENDLRAICSAWLCRDIVGANDAESNPMMPLGVRVLLKTAREEGW